MKSGKSNQHQQPFRETGKFKPIESTPPTERISSSHCTLKSLQTISLGQQIPTQQELNKEFIRWWRVYFQQTLTSYERNSLTHILETSFDILISTNQLEQSKNANIFINANGVLLQRLRGVGDCYFPSNLDHNCVIIKQQGTPGKRIFQGYEIKGNRGSRGGEFCEEVSIRIKQESLRYFIVSKGKILFLIKDPNIGTPTLEITDHNLEETVADIKKKILIIKNLSPRIVAIKFQQQNFNRNTEPLQLQILNPTIFQTILFRINRIKLIKFKVDDQPQGKEWHSFDLKMQKESKKQSKTTPEKPNNIQRPQIPNTILNKVSNVSTTNAVQETKPNQQKKSNKVIMNQPTRHLKISQRVVHNPKQSNLVPSQLDYPVSVKDQKEKDSPYFDEFQNLLFEEEGAEQKQLALNDSFEQFQKKEHSEKNKQIIKELHKRKEKENQEKIMLDNYKERIKQLINEEKQWINKNLKLKIQIKKLKTTENSEQSKEMEEVKTKLGQMRAYQKKLIEDLKQIKNQNNIEVLVFDNNEPRGSKQSSQSQQSQRNSDNKIVFNSLSIPLSNPLTSSIRSNNGANLKQSLNQPQPVTLLSGSKSSCGTTFKNNYNPNYAQYPIANYVTTNNYYNSQTPNIPPQANIYASMQPSHSFIQHHYNPQGSHQQQTRPPPIQTNNLANNNDYGGLPQRNHNFHQGNGLGFTSAIYSSGTNGMVNSPLVHKKNSMQTFLTSATKN